VTEAKPLAELTVGGVMNTDRFSVSLWESWYTYLRNRTEHRSLRHFAGHVQRHNDGVDLDRYLLEARPLLAGSTVSVGGELRLEQGERVLHGTDETPLVLSDSGFDGHRRWLRRRVFRKGAVAVGLLLVAASVWFAFYVPLVVLVGGSIVYWAYSFVQDLGVVVEWLRR